MNFTNIVLIIGLIMILGCFGALYRNSVVFKYRGEILRKMSIASKKDIKNGKEWDWRHDVWDTITYNQMMVKFWKPIDSFYTDKKFIK